MPDVEFAKLADPGLLHVLPVVVGYRTGKVLYGFRGALLGPSRPWASSSG